MQPVQMPMDLQEVFVAHQISMEEKIEDKKSEINQENKSPIEKLNSLPSKVKILIGVIILMVILLSIFSFISMRQAPGEATTEEERVNLTTPEASVYFSPSTVNATPGKETTVDIIINTWGKEISGINLSVKYNPNILSDVKLEQFRDTTSAVSYAFEETFAAENDPNNGVITLPLSMLETTPEQKGEGIVAKLSFTPKDAYTNLTQITFDVGTALINRNSGKTIVLQKGILNINLPVDGVFPTEIPQKRIQ